MGTLRRPFAQSVSDCFGAWTGEGAVSTVYIYIYIDVRDGFGGLDLFGGCIERLSPCSQTHQLFLFGIVFEMPNEALF